MSEKKHPIQPLIIDDLGIIRFKSNAIVRWLLDKGPFDMNQIAIKGFNREDQEQFAQLIGYSHSGAADLSYMSNEVIEVAEAMHKSGKSEIEAKYEYVQSKLDEVRRCMRPAVAELFDVSEDFDDV